MSERLIYKLLNHEDARAADLSYTSNTALDAADGYVHLSTRAQVAETAALHYKGLEGVVLMEFDTAELGGAMRWEASRGGDLFPHLYAPLDVRKAARRWTVQLNNDGIPQMPDDF